MEQIAPLIYAVATIIVLSGFKRLIDQIADLRQRIKKLEEKSE